MLSARLYEVPPSLCQQRSLLKSLKKFTECLLKVNSLLYNAGMKNWLEAHRVLSLTLAFTVVCVLTVLAINDPAHFKSLAEAFTGSGTTIATIGLALSTSWLVYVTFRNLRENQIIRRADIELRTKQRVFDEYLLVLEQICNWAQDAIKTLTPAGSRSDIFLMSMQDDLPAIATKSISIEYDVTSLPENSSLLERINEATDLLEDFIKFMDLKKQSLTIEDEYVPRRDKLKKCFENVIEIASGLKVTLKKGYPTE